MPEIIHSDADEQSLEVEPVKNCQTADKQTKQNPPEVSESS